MDAKPQFTTFDVHQRALRDETISSIRAPVSSAPIWTPNYLIFGASGERADSPSEIQKLDKVLFGDQLDDPTSAHEAMEVMVAAIRRAAVVLINTPEAEMIDEKNALGLGCFNYLRCSPDFCKGKDKIYWADCIEKLTEIAEGRVSVKEEESYAQLYLTRLHQAIQQTSNLIDRVRPIFCKVVESAVRDQHYPDCAVHGLPAVRNSRLIIMDGLISSDYGYQGRAAANQLKGSLGVNPFLDQASLVKSTIHEFIHLCSSTIARVLGEHTELKVDDVYFARSGIHLNALYDVAKRASPANVNVAVNEAITELLTYQIFSSIVGEKAWTPEMNSKWLTTGMALSELIPVATLYRAYFERYTPGAPELVALNKAFRLTFGRSISEVNALLEQENGVEKVAILEALAKRSL